MKGIYKTKEGSKVEVLDFDEANKIAMIKISDTQNRWVDESEYSGWVAEGEEPATDETANEISSEETREESAEPKQKKTRKKKEE